VRLIAPMLAFAALAACDSGTERRDEVASTRAVQRAHTAIPSGTAPRGTAARAAALLSPGAPSTPELLDRGRNRFLIFCSPCHGARGRGDGLVVSRGFPAPPSYHQKRLREAPPQHIVSVITNGTGIMHSYADRIAAEDRWAIAHHVKSLQRAEAQAAGASQ
jgi:mono/diheme cytochrome c family protein